MPISSRTQGEHRPDGREHQEHDRPLAGFKRRYRKAEGIKRLKRGADIPIAVLVPKVALKKRLDVERLVAGRIPRLSAAIEKQIGRWIDSWRTEFPSSLRSKGPTRGSNAPSRRPSAVSASSRPPPRPPVKAPAGMAEVKAGCRPSAIRWRRPRPVAGLPVDQLGGGQGAGDRQIADAWNMMSARLKLATAGQREFTGRAEGALFDIAQRIGVPIRKPPRCTASSSRRCGCWAASRRTLTITEHLAGAAPVGRIRHRGAFVCCSSGRRSAPGVLRGENSTPSSRTAPSGAGPGRWPERAHRAAAQAGRRRPPDRRRGGQRADEPEGQAGQRVRPTAADGQPGLRAPAQRLRAVDQPGR